MGRRLPRSRREWALALALLVEALALVVVLMLGEGVWLYFALASWLSPPKPSTPMTGPNADRLVGQVFQTGRHRDEVERWLVVNGFALDPGLYPEGINYSVWRREDANPTDWRMTMDGIGKQSAAELAGLETDDICSYIRVSWPDAQRYLFGQTEVRVYFFFDANDRLLRHWTTEINMGL